MADDPRPEAAVFDTRPEAAVFDTRPEAAVFDTRPEAVVFDKDGTLLDFAPTWSDALCAAIEASAHSPADADEAARALGIDRSTGRFTPDSLFLVGPNDACDDLTRHLLDLPSYRRVLAERSSAGARPLPGAVELLEALAAVGVPMAVMTNDSEEMARTQLGGLGLLAHFTTVMGFDSGFGGKPGPAPLVEAARRLGVGPDRCLMVGDTGHDIDAGIAAGMRTALISADGDDLGLDPTIVVRRPDELLVHLT